MLWIVDVIEGPVCCFSVVVVKMLEGVSVTTLPEPENLPVLTYDEAHRQGAGAYIAELFDPDVLPESVFLGDNSRINTASLPCKSCQGIFWRPDDTIVRRSSLEDSSQMINVGTLSYDGLLSPESNYTIFLRVMFRFFSFFFFLFLFSLSFLLHSTVRLIPNRKIKKKIFGNVLLNSLIILH